MSGAAPNAEDVRRIHEAAAWYARLRSGEATDEQQAQWQAWMAADASHRQAWQRIESVCSRFGQVPASLGAATLTAVAAPRRKVLRGAVVVMSLGPAGWLGYRGTRDGDVWPALLAWRADMRTAVGERREWSLVDGSSLWLNTDSAADAVYDDTQRLVRLHAGEVLLSSHADDHPGGPRPLSVDTPHGRVRALGTRFIVRLDATGTTVTVLEHAVSIEPARAPGAARRLTVGQWARFDAGHCGAAAPASSAAAMWTRGRLVVADMPLQDVLRELGRHRRGHLGCDAAIAAWRVSGAFPLDDTDEALAALADSFPLRIERFTRYWTRLVPAA